ncbi:hypothetical protein JCM5350_003464 [Sporobolomyces pararoseus]
MSSSVENSLYDIKKSAEDETKLQHSHGPDLRFETASCSMHLNPDTIIPEPDKFQFKWTTQAPYKLNAELLRITIWPDLKEQKTVKHLVGFSKPIVLEGDQGSISLLNLVPQDTFKVLSSLGGKSSAIRFHFRPRPNAESFASSESLRFHESEMFPVPQPEFDVEETESNSVPMDKAQVDQKKIAETQDSFKIDKSLHGRPGTEGTGDDGEELGPEDSDLEDDFNPPSTPSPPVRVIPVHNVAYRTLFSYLHYLETDSIHFSTLSSLLRDSPRSPPSASSTSISSSPPTCSPKSMYLLSHLYEHSKLRQLAFNSISTQLGSNNALTEYFSDLSSLYPEIKTICMKAVLDNWEVVKDSKEMESLKLELEKGKLDKLKIDLLFELFGKLKPAV